MPTVQELAKDKRFWDLSDEARLLAASEADSKFGGLSPEAQAIVLGKLKPGPSQLREFGSSLIEQFNPIPLAKAGWEAVQHPIETPKALIQDLASRYANIPTNLSKGISELRQGEIQKGTGDILFAHPGIQMTLGEAREQLEADRPGAAMGTATGIGIQALAPAAGIKGLKATRLPAKLTEKAAKRFTQALKPTKLAMKERTEKIVPELLERRVSATSLPKLADKAKASKELANDALEEAWANLPAGKTVDADRIFNTLDNAKTKFIEADVVMNPAAVKHLEDFQGMLLELVGKQGNQLDVHSLRRVRQIWDRMVGEAEGFQLDPKEASRLSAAKEASGAIRKELAKDLPNIAKLNKEVSFWIDVEDAAKETIKRTKGQEPSLSTTLFGAAAGGGSLAHTGSLIKAIATGTLFKQTLGLFRSPGWRMISAVQRAKLADALTSGSLENVAFELGALTATANQKARK